MLQSTFTWLATEPPDDPVADLVSIQRHLKQVTSAALQPAQRLKIFDLFQGRVDTVGSRLKPHLFEARLPLQPPLRMIAQGLIYVHGVLANGLLGAHRELSGNSAQSCTTDLALLGTVIHNELCSELVYEGKLMVGA
jgi:hypothetical protein